MAPIQPLRTIRRARLPGGAAPRGYRTPALYGLRIVREGATAETAPQGQSLTFPVRMRVYAATGKERLAEEYFIHDEGWHDFGGIAVQVELWAHRHQVAALARATIEYSTVPLGRIPGTTPEASRCMYDSGVVAGGFAISTGQMVTRECKELLFVVNNGDGAARNLAELILLNEEDGLAGTVIRAMTTLRAVAAGATEVGAYGPAASALGNDFAIARLPPPLVQYTLVAGAGGNARLTIFGR